MAEKPTTVPTTADVDAFVAAVPDERRRRDARTLLALLGEATGEPPTMWGYLDRRLRVASLPVRDRA